MSKQYTDEELEYCRKRLEDLGYHDSINLDDSEYGEPDSIVIIDEEDILNGNI